LKDTGIKITNQRRKLRDLALALDLKDGNMKQELPEITTALASKIQKGFHTTKRRKLDDGSAFIIEEVPIPLR
jgi:hypothetical protein